MATTLYYFSATGNSLYAAKRLQSLLADAELYSIPEMLRSGEIVTTADKVGVIFPQHYYGLPMVVEDFARKLAMPNVSYLFAVVTCGLPYIGRPFSDFDEILREKNLHLDARWYLRLVSNYLLYRNTAADWRIRFRYRLAEKRLTKLARQIKENRPHSTWELRKAWSKEMHTAWEARRTELDKRFICDTSKCVRCGMCEGICPVNNIKRPGGFPQWQHNCVECLGCLHICPRQAIDCGEVTKGRKRYIHWQVKPQELLQKER